MVKGRKGTHQKEFEAARKSGYARVRVDGILYDLTETIDLAKNKKPVSYTHIDVYKRQPPCISLWMESMRGIS